MTRKRIIVTITSIAAIMLVIGAWALLQFLQPALQIGDAKLTVRVARSDAELQQGLSGSEPLAEDKGLLFVFGTSQKWSFWMKDMKFPIDIIWLDKDKTVVYVAKNLQPSSYPTTYAPPVPAKYVLETKSGVAEHKRITIGSKAVFDSEKGTYK